ERAIAALAESARHGRRIEFYGVGNSGIVAQDAQHKFFRLGVNTAACSDGHVQLMSATMLQPGDCAVIISNSGRSRDLIDAAEIARKKGATTIIITASGSPLAALGQSPGQVLLAVDHPEDFDRYSPMVSRLLHLTAIDILTTGVALQLGQKLRPVLQEIKRNLRSKRYAS
ncbi:MAG: SIS domain-containing protein, partial [Paucibacter sp.]|nr:SIS domain-containing protein [Roseateles sp.]